MKKIYLALIICIFAYMTLFGRIEKASAAGLCTEYRPQSVKLVLSSSYGKLRYNHNYNNSKLAAMAASHNLGQVGMYTAGLSLADIVWTLSLDTVSYNSGDSVCIVPVKVNVFVGFQDPTIYISSELPKNSCQYQVVLRHEQQHQQINTVLLDYYLPILKQKMEQKLSVLKMQIIKRGQDKDAMVEKMNNQYMAAVRPLIDDLKQILNTEQRRLDTRENYQYETKICN